MSKIDTSKISNILLFYLRVGGLWPTGDYFPIIYRIYGLTFLTISLYGYTVFIVINLFKIENIAELIEAMFMCFINIALIIKTVTFMVKYQTLRRILKIIQNFELNDGDSVEQRFVVEKIKYFMKILLVYYIVSNLSLLGIDVGCALADEPKLMWKAWYPIDWQHNRLYYWIVFAYQSIGMRIEATLNITLDLFPTFLLSMMGAMLDILGRRMEKIGNENEMFGKELDANRDEIDKERFNALVEVIRSHQEICE